MASSDGQDGDALQSPVAREYFADVLVGVIDVLFHMGKQLEYAGFFTREQVAKFMGEIEAGIDRQAERLGHPKDQPNPEARKLAASILRRAFETPLLGERKFGLVTGGKDT
jgi:hypothetical protein